MTSFKTKHEDISFEIYSSYGVACDIYELSFPKPIYCATLKFSEPEQVKLKWMAINKALSISISEQFINDFQKWNFYIVYLCDFELTKELKYKIENNKSYSRKITLSKSDIKDRDILDIFKEEVVFTDIGNKIGKIIKSQRYEQEYRSDIISMIPTESIKSEQLQEIYQAVSDKLEKPSEA